MRQAGRHLPTAGKRIRRCSWRVLSLLVVVAMPTIAWAKSAPRDDSARIEVFEKKVRPLLVDNCYTCHSADTNSRGGLRVDDRNGLLDGGGRGPAVVPGKPEKSLLIQAVRSRGELKMPPRDALSRSRSRLKAVDSDGAAWPRVESVASDRQIDADYQKLRKEHWAWQPLREPQVPAVARRGVAARRHRPLPPRAHGAKKGSSRSATPTS